jgi:hypothetical protein
MKRALLLSLLVMGIGCSSKKPTTPAPPYITKLSVSIDSLTYYSPFNQWVIHYTFGFQDNNGIRSGDKVCNILYVLFNYVCRDSTSHSDTAYIALQGRFTPLIDGQQAAYSSLLPVASRPSSVFTLSTYASWSGWSGTITATRDFGP